MGCCPLSVSGYFWAGIVVVHGSWEQQLRFGGRGDPVDGINGKIERLLSFHPLYHGFSESRHTREFLIGWRRQM